MHLLLAFDSFKESMSSLTAAAAFRRGFSRGRPGARFTTLSVSDGGEGFTEAFLHNLGGRRAAARVRDPLGRPMRASFGLFDRGRKAVVETAAASGLALLPPRLRDPFKTSSYGTGQLLAAALDRGVREIVVGLGGSATNDAGLGLAQALGARLLDDRGEVLPAPFTGTDLSRLAALDLTDLDPRLKKVRIVAACDVDNPMTGRYGASAVYGPQKGATPSGVRRLDRGLKKACAALRRATGRDVEKRPGAGAAGGLGGGLMALLGAELRPGIEIVLSQARMDRALRGIDLTVTGEGQTDFQTARNKAPSGVARAARGAGVPVLCLCGRIGPGAEAVYKTGINALLSILPGPCVLEQALREGPINMARTAEQLGRIFRLTGKP